jgi:hypothetical protein
LFQELAKETQYGCFIEAASLTVLEREGYFENGTLDAR